MILTLLLTKVAPLAITGYASYRLAKASASSDAVAAFFGSDKGAAKDQHEPASQQEPADQQEPANEESKQVRFQRELNSLQRNNKALKRLGLGFVTASAATLTGSAALWVLATGVLGVVVIQNIAKRAYFKLRYKGQVGTECVGLTMMVLLGVSAQLTVLYVMVFLIHFAERARIRTETHAQESIQGLVSAQVGEAWLVTPTGEVQVPVSQLAPGDVVVVYTGELVPCDGAVTEGFGTVDQQILTGEAQPADKAPGDMVFASTLVMQGKLFVEVHQAGEATVVAKIARLLDSTFNFATLYADSRANKVADKLALPVLGATSVLLGLSGLRFATTAVTGWGSARMRIVSSVGILNYLRVAAARGILIKDIRAAEMFYDADVVLFDKTGTLTESVPEVSRIWSFQTEFDEREILEIAAFAEVKWSHPIAAAIIGHAESQGIVLPNENEGEYEIGYGVRVSIRGQSYQVGSWRFMNLEGAGASQDVERAQSHASDAGGTLVYVASREKIIGAIELKPKLRPDAAETVRALKASGIKSVGIVSGDTERETKRLAGELGVDLYYAEMLPEDKARVISELQEQGKTVCFIGDGINDALALKQAQVSISMMGASFAATESAQITLMRSDLSLILSLQELSAEMYQNVNQACAVSLITPALFSTGAAFAGATAAPVVLVNLLTLMGGVRNSMEPARQLQKETSWSLRTVLEELYLTPETWRGHDTSTEQPNGEGSGVHNGSSHRTEANQTLLEGGAQ